MKRLSLAVACAAALALGACTTLTGNPVADAKAAQSNIQAATNPQAFLDNLNAFNQAAGKYCGGYGNLDWNPPLPPTGSLHLQCAVGQKAPGAIVAPAAPAPAAPAAPAPAPAGQ